MATLEVRGLTKKYRGVPVVNDVSFTMSSSEITGYLGPNGSGKSTTVKMLTGLVEPTGGQILYDGVNVRRDPIGFKRRLGYVPEEALVYPSLTGMEYLQLMGRLRGMPETDINEKASDLLQLFGLHLRKHSPLASYSKGMRQRVLLSAALLHDPDILIFDEPLSGLDVSSALLFKHLITELSARGKIILYISHVLEVVERVCAKVIIIYKGKIMAEDNVGRLRDLMQLPSLEEIFTQLVQQENMEEVARDIVEAIHSRGKMMDRQFLTLVKHFFSRFFDKESRTAESDAYTGMVQLLALLVMPGLVLSFFLMTEPPAYYRTFSEMWGRIGDHYTFICYAIVVMGLVMTFKWDSLFPDRRDYQILSALPISFRRLFAAKVVALTAFLGLFVVAINFISLFITPLSYPNPMNSWGWYIDAFEAHALAVLGASLFTALSFAALQGVLINVLTPTAFRRVSPRIQMVSITLLVMVFLTLPLFKAGIRPLSENFPDALGYFPFIWFLGLYESFLPGQILMPMSHVWAFSAMKALGLMGILCIGSYAIGYRRYSKKLLESIDSDAIHPHWWETIAAAILDRTLLRDPYQRATFHFIGKIASRSNIHRIMTALYTGIGIALAISFAFIFVPRSTAALPFRMSSQGSLEAPVMLCLLLITGLRASFNIPYEIGANWMFQITGSGDSGSYLKAVRKWVFVSRIVPLYLILAPLEFLLFEPSIAIGHILFDLALAAVVTEVFFFTFNKVPFTCSYPQDKFRLAGIAIGYFYGFVMYVGIMGQLKRVTTADPVRLAKFLGVAIGIRILFSLVRRLNQSRHASLLFTDDADPLVRGLDLS